MVSAEVAPGFVLQPDLDSNGPMAVALKYVFSLYPSVVYLSDFLFIWKAEVFWSLELIYFYPISQYFLQGGWLHGADIFIQGRSMMVKRRGELRKQCRGGDFIWKAAGTLPNLTLFATSEAIWISGSACPTKNNNHLLWCFFHCSQIKWIGDLVVSGYIYLILIAGFVRKTARKLSNMWSLHACFDLMWSIECVCLQHVWFLLNQSQPLSFHLLTILRFLGTPPCHYLEEFQNDQNPGTNTPWHEKLPDTIYIPFWRWQCWELWVCVQSLKKVKGQIG